jgi:hypothetical protein
MSTASAFPDAFQSFIIASAITTVPFNIIEIGLLFGTLIQRLKI